MPVINGHLRKAVVRSLRDYAAPAVLSLVIVILFLNLWKADFHVPFCYEADGLQHAAIVKGMIDNGWYWRNPYLGAPDGLQLYDFPVVDTLSLVLMKGISLASSDYGIVLNLFFLLTFPLTAICAMFAFRQLQLSYAGSLFASQLYTFLPYHFMRNSFGHLFLAAYYLIPLVIVVLWWLASDALLEKRTGFRINLRGFKVIFSVVVCVLVGSSGVYYPFFSCFFLLLTGVVVSLGKKTISPLIVSGLFVGVIVGTVMINLSPSLVHIYKNGNIHVAERVPADAETFGLKISQLLLPISGHRIKSLAQTKWKYNHGPLYNENDTASLGMFAAAGFLSLLGWIGFRKPAITKMDFEGARGLLNLFSLLCLVAVLFGTIGGFGSLFALAITPQIRTYNRISVFIAFFSLIPIALLIDTLFRKYQDSKIGKVGSLFIFAIALTLGILDQTGPSFKPNYLRTKSEYANDAEFVNRIETAVPAGAMIFQLPYVPFPESPPMFAMRDSELFRPYLHSRSLRWSYGAMKGRKGDLWQKAIVNLPVDKFVQSLSTAGFSGIYLDRRAYADGGADMEKKLVEYLGLEPQSSRDGKRLFFSIVEYNQSRPAAAQSEPLLVNWLDGFSSLEGTPEDNWRWCSSSGELLITNASQQNKTVSLEMLLVTSEEEKASVIVSGPDSSQDLRVGTIPVPFSKTVTIPPGTYSIKFASDAKRVDAPLDPRVLVFKVVNFRLRELD